MTPPPNLLRSVLLRYPLLCGEVGSIADYGRVGFSGAGVWRVETAVGPVAVRRWPAGWSADRLRGLHRLLEHVRSHGLACVAVPFRSASGDTLTDLDRSWWQIEPWLPGQADFHQQPSRERLSAAMKALAQWHLSASRFTLRPTDSAWFQQPHEGHCPAAEERLRAVGQCVPADIHDWGTLARNQIPDCLRPFVHPLVNGVLTAIPLIRGELLHATTRPAPLQPCLRDVWHDHLLFTGQEVTGLIDPSACRTDTVATDLARLLGSLVEDQSAEWSFALEEYDRVRPLSIWEQRLIPILDRSGVVLSAVTWLKWLGPEARWWDDPAPVVDRLQRLVGRLERLANRV